ncbi:hypothetical protein ACS0TY_012474 [Phlomoides rotata]
MKRGKDEEKIMGPMFPRLHVNDTEKGGPRAPPRNKMALYEQLSIPSQRSSRMVIQCNLNNNVPNSVPPSSQGGGYDGGMFFSRQVRPRYPSEKQYSEYSELSTQLPRVVEQRKQLDEDDCSVPIFIQPIPTEFDNYSNNTNSYKTSLSNPAYMHPSLKLQQAKETHIFESSMKQTVSSEDLPSENQNIVHDLSNDTGSGDDGSCGPQQTGNLERGDSVSESSILDTVSSPDITPDDVVGIIGQKHFWKARRAIVNQQRIFAVQVFELHRLMKVQKLISDSPHLMLDDSAFFDKPVVKPLPSKKRPLEGYSLKVISNDPKKKRDLEKEARDEKEVSAENTVDKALLSSPQNRVSPSSLNGPPPPPSNHNGGTTCFSHPQTHQWLVPVMSPTEGLVYKPYPGTGGPPPVGSFPTPMYGIPAPPHQYPFPPFGSHGYFSPYAMPMMTTPAFSGSSVDQTNPPTVPTQKDVAVPDRQKSNAAEETEVQGSTASCPSERQTSRRASNGRRDMLPLFPTSPATDVGPEVPVAEKPSRVIKVVPHNSMTASESAARIFRSIQEERKQFDAV